MRDEPINTGKVRRARHLLLALLTLGFLLGVLPAAQAASDTFTPIDFPGASATSAGWINEHGQIVGVYDSGGVEHGFLYDKGVFTTLDVPGASATGAYRINEHGQIVGYYISSGVGHGFLYDKGVFTTLDVPGASATSAYGINERGQIVGGYTSGGVGHGFLYDKGVFTTLDVPGASSTLAWGINERGQIVGSYYTSSRVEHGFLYDKGVFTTLDVPGASATSAQGINKYGQIVGVYDSSGVQHGFLATPPQESAALAPFIVPQTAEPGSGGQTAAAYGWWNLAVLLLATIGLLVLSRVRLSVIPAETARGEPSLAEHSASKQIRRGTMPRICNACGKQNREQARFCGYCGRPLQSATPQPMEETREAPHVAPWANWLGQVPGFRPGTRWKQISAAVGYTCIAFAIVAGVAIADAALLVLGVDTLVIVLLATDAWSLRSRVPLFNSPSKLKAAGGWGILLILGLGVLSAVVTGRLRASSITSALLPGLASQRPPVPTEQRAQLKGEDLPYPEIVDPGSPDGRGWVLGYTQDLGVKALSEFVLPGETVENWTELVTVQSWDKQRSNFPPPETAMNLKKEQLMHICPTIRWNIIERREGSILYEWRIENCPLQPDQMEIARFFEGKRNRFRLAYAAKGKGLPPGKRAELIKWLSQAKAIDRGNSGERGTAQ